MSTSTVLARQEEARSTRPVPWRRMAWVTWRQHRAVLAGTCGLLGVLAVYVWRAGRQLHHAYAVAVACRPADSIACSEVIRRFNDMNLHLANGFVWQPVPALIGAFVGAPVLARELETGTFRYAWTQGFGRWRWTLAKLVLLAVAMVAAAGAFSLLLSWYYRPYFAAGSQTVFLSQVSPLTAGLFDLRGVAFAAWTLTAFAVGALVGVLTRRVVPAIVVTLAVYAGLALAAGMVLRRHYEAALLSSKPNVPATAWIMSEWWTKGGGFAFRGLPPMNLLQRFCPPSSVGPGKPAPGSLAQCLSQHGYTQWTSYQPAGRFWSFQLIEGSWLLALSLLLVASTVWLVHRRAA